jgi:hypothetical protein
MHGDTFEELVVRAFSGGEQLNSIFGSRASGMCCTSYGEPTAGTSFCGCCVEELVIPVMGAVADHWMDTHVTVTLVSASKDRSV